MPDSCPVFCLRLAFALHLSALRRVRDSNPRYDVMRTPHFECGSFDHSDNSPSRELKIFGGPN